MNKQTQISIRTTPDERISVIDIIKLISGETNPQQTWQTICQNYPEIANKCENHVFADGNLVPVAEHQTALTIIDLLSDDFTVSHWNTAVQFLQTRI